MFLDNYKEFYLHFKNHLEKLGYNIEDFEFSQFDAQVFNEGTESEVRLACLSYYLKEDEDTSLTIEYKVDKENKIIKVFDEDALIESD